MTGPNDSDDMAAHFLRALADVMADPTLDDEGPDWPSDRITSPDRGPYPVAPCRRLAGRRGARGRRMGSHRRPHRHRRGRSRGPRRLVARLERDGATVTATASWAWTTRARRWAGQPVDDSGHLVRVDTVDADSTTSTATYPGTVALDQLAGGTIPPA